MYACRNVCVVLRQMYLVKLLCFFLNLGNLIYTVVKIRFNVIGFVCKTLAKQMPCIFVTCCVWAMLFDNGVRVVTSSLTRTSSLSVTQPSRKGADACETRSSFFCAGQRNNYSNGTVSISLDWPFHVGTG